MNENNISHSLSITSYALPTLNMSSPPGGEPTIVINLDTDEKYRVMTFALEMANKIKDHRKIREKAIASKKYDEKDIQILFLTFQLLLKNKIIEFVEKWYDEGDERTNRYDGLMAFLIAASGHYIGNTYQNIHIIELAGKIATYQYTTI